MVLKLQEKFYYINLPSPQGLYNHLYWPSQRLYETLLNHVYKFAYIFLLALAHRYLILQVKGLAWS